MPAQQRTMLGWWEYLDTKGRDLTLDEFRALMSLHAREYARATLELTRDQKDAIEHVEGILGARDAFDALIAERTGMPYPSSAKVRAFLDKRRDEERRALATTEGDEA